MPAVKNTASNIGDKLKFLTKRDIILSLVIMLLTFAFVSTVGYAIIAKTQNIVSLSSVFVDINNDGETDLLLFGKAIINEPSDLELFQAPQQ